MLNIALAASGAGHIRRGIEIWIESLHRRLSGRCRAVLFKGGGTEAGGERVLPCLRRDARIWGGVSSPIPWTARMYAERLSFAPALLGRLKEFDILHTADPFLAALAVYFRKAGYWKGATLLSYQGPGPVWGWYANRVGHVQFLDESYLTGPGARCGTAAGPTSSPTSWTPMCSAPETPAPRGALWRSTFPAPWSSRWERSRG